MKKKLKEAVKSTEKSTNWSGEKLSRKISYHRGLYNVDTSTDLTHMT